MKRRVPTSIAERELDRRQFLRVAGATAVLGVAGIVGGDLLLGCAPAKAPAAGEVPAGYESIRMVGSGLGTAGTTAVMAYAALLNKYYPEIEWSATSGLPATNVIYLTKGTIKLGFVMHENYVATYGFDKISESRLRSMTMPVALLQWVFVIPEDKPWKDITDVPKGLTLCPGSPGSPGIGLCEAWLGLAGLSKKDFNWIPLTKGELTDAWRTGKVDVAFLGLPGTPPYLLDMYISPRKVKAMGLSPGQTAKAKAEQTFERIGYGAPSMSILTQIGPDVFKYDVLAVQAPYFLGSRDDFPEEIAYKMAKIIDERNAELVSIFAQMKWGTPQWHVQWARPPLDIHSGVAKYYREKGHLK